MKIKERKEIKKTETIISGIKCDVCGQIHKGNDIPDEWHEFYHHHNEWGNDSIESYEYHHVCSVRCYAIKFNECIKDLEGYHDAEIDGFEIQFARQLSKVLLIPVNFNL